MIVVDLMSIHPPNFGGHGMMPMLVLLILRTVSMSHYKMAQPTEEKCYYCCYLSSRSDMLVADVLVLPTLQIVGV